MNRLAWRRIAVFLLLLAAFAVGSVISAQRSSAAMVSAAAALLANLAPEQRTQATFAFDTDERVRWHFIPDENFPRKGLPLGAMSEPQRRLAHDLLRTGLSQRGYLTYTGIIELEGMLRTIEGGGRLARDPDAYRFSVFGTPSTIDPWGWRVEGHHISLHFTMVDGAIVATPSFAGTNPAEVRDGPQAGRRVLGPQEDAARALVTALDAEQRSRAVFDTEAPRDILTENMPEVEPLSQTGIPAMAMSEAQRTLLMDVVRTFTSLMADDIAAERTGRIRNAGVENITFAWAGSTARGEQHYFRVQGPTFLIEFDNTQGGGNHVHSVWRDFEGDFGRDLLREHLAANH